MVAVAASASVSPEISKCAPAGKASKEAVVEQVKRSGPAKRRRTTRSKGDKHLQLEFFSIPAQQPGEAADELRRFISSHRVAAIDRQFVADGQNSYWAICVTFIQGNNKLERPKGKIDYREVLGEREFSVFAKLRTLRKKRAEEEGVPAYALFTNEQLAEMVREKVTSLSKMGEIDGIGQARIQKYGQAFIDILTLQRKVSSRNYRIRHDNF